MISDVTKAIGQLPDPRFRNVLVLGIGLALALLVGFSFLFITGVQWLIGPSVSLPWIGEVTWLAEAAGWASVPVVMVLSVFLMVPVASAFTGIFLERIADAVEDRHYPGLPRASGAPLATAIRDSIGFLGLILGVNLLALLAYLILAPLAPLIFWGVNGVLLGREYAQMVALRRLSRAEANAFRRRNRFSIWALGVIMAVPLTVPVLNLLVPVIGAAAFTHLYHRVGPHRQSA
ncbi:EI24 domain-containing protein [Thalassobacter stenotrophicus]|uniref:EI24 domain-containing protein n=1 Tax=Thalassobacter stenotrophicus TaxID=266809 RepID=UPI0022A92B74|nr:EI24 domain-containing protein [Thalassobacter stenotrophicus]UYP66982.1 EI24 domain-containing protein [Thalassobacter stenotrophicus]